MFWKKNQLTRNQYRFMSTWKYLNVKYRVALLSRQNWTVKSALSVDLETAYQAFGSTARAKQAITVLVFTTGFVLASLHTFLLPLASAAEPLLFRSQKELVCFIRRVSSVIDSLKPWSRWKYFIILIAIPNVQIVRWEFEKTLRCLKVISCMHKQIVSKETQWTG